MIRGLYTSGWSMLANSRKMDVISNNLANVNTNAFKKDGVVFQSFPEVLAQRINDTQSRTNPDGQIGAMELGSDVGEIYTYYTQGAMTKTGNNLDLSIKDSATSFFTVGVPSANGDIVEYYTRDGAFSIDAKGQLVTSEGNLVLGEAGPILLTSEHFEVMGDGSIIQDGKNVGKLLIRNFADPSTLRKQGSDLVARTQQTRETEFNGVVLQGSVEQSNVNIVKEMVDMISVTRAYEASQKVLQAQDGTLEKAVNEVGALR